MSTQLYCPTNARRSLVLGTTVNGVDYLEVLPSKRTLSSASTDEVIINITGEAWGSTESISKDFHYIPVH